MNNYSGLDHELGIFFARRCIILYLISDIISNYMKIDYENGNRYLIHPFSVVGIFLNQIIGPLLILNYLKYVQLNLILNGTDTGS